MESLTIVNSGVRVVGNPEATNEIKTNSGLVLTFNQTLGALAPEMEALISLVEIGSTSGVMMADVVASEKTLTITPERFKYGRSYQLIIKKEFTVTNAGMEYSQGVISP